jgi:hypothetical protein
MNAHPDIEVPVLSWWPELYAALGDRYQHDPTRSADGIVDLADPLQNPEGFVARWGPSVGTDGRLFLLRGTSAYLNLLAGRGVIFLRRSVKGMFVIHEAAESGPRSIEVGPSPADAIRWIDERVAADQQSSRATPSRAP